MSDEAKLYLPDGKVKLVNDNRLPAGAWTFIGIFISLTCFVIGGAVGSSNKKPKPSKPSDPQQVVSGIYISAPGGGIGSGTWSVAQYEQYQADQEAKTERETEKKQSAWDHRPYLAAPEDAPPASIKVGPFHYSVYWTTAKALSSQDALALTMIEKREIWLDPTRTASLREDVLHEVMHCAKSLGTGGSRFHGYNGDEENLIEGTSSGLLEVLQDNPELVEWLRKRP